MKSSTFTYQSKGISTKRRAQHSENSGRPIKISGRPKYPNGNFQQ